MQILKSPFAIYLRNTNSQYQQTITEKKGNILQSTHARYILVCDTTQCIGKYIYGERFFAFCLIL